ncbi:MAG: hypothetical protein AB8C13_05510 [Phycisphaerales bacterium]
MNTQNRKRKTWALIAIGASALLGGIAPTASAGSDVYFSVSSSNHSYSSSRSSIAGVLSIDGTRFTIRSHRNIGQQIVNAFRRCGYEARCEYGRVIVCYDRYDHPRVHWSNRSFKASISECDGEMSIGWKKISRRGFTHKTRQWNGSKWRNGRDHDRGYQPRRKGRRGSCG